MYQIILRDVIKATEKTTFYEGTCSQCEVTSDLYNDTLVLDIYNLETEEHTIEELKNLHYSPSGTVGQYVTNAPAFAQWLQRQIVLQVDDLPLAFLELCQQYQWYQADLNEINNFWGAEQHQLIMVAEHQKDPRKRGNMYVTDLPRPSGDIYFPEKIPEGTYWVGDLKPVWETVYNEFLPIFFGLEYPEQYMWVGEALDLCQIEGFDSNAKVRGFYIGFWRQEVLVGAAGVFYGLENYVPRQLLEEHGTFITVTASDKYKAMYNCDRISIIDNRGHEVAGHSIAEVDR